MLYLDLMSRDGGQMYIDIQSVEMFARGRRRGILLQGVLGDGCWESRVLVEQVDGDVSVTCLDGSAGASLQDGLSGEDVAGAVRLALKQELGRARFAPGIRRDQAGGRAYGRPPAGDGRCDADGLPLVVAEAQPQYGRS